VTKKSKKILPDFDKSTSDKKIKGKSRPFVSKDNNLAALPQMKIQLMLASVKHPQSRKKKSAMKYNKKLGRIHFTPKNSRNMTNRTPSRRSKKYIN
jgi:hypothetical protein